MTTPVAGIPVVLGPGTLKVGPSASALDVSCLVKSATFSYDKDADDPETGLCGTVYPGDVTYTGKLAGTVWQDIAAGSGLVQFSHANKGQTVEFEFVPNTAAVTAVTGTLVIDPLGIGGDEFGKKMTSDFEWTVADADIAWPT